MEELGVLIIKHSWRNTKMQRQRVRIRDGKHFTENENHGTDWLLVAGIFGLISLAVTLVWAIGSALAL